MAVQWDMYHVNINRGAIRIVRGTIGNNGEMKTMSYSDNRTDEVISCVAAKMKHDLKKRKDNRGYIGYEIPYVGKLVLVEPGYDLSVTKTE